MQQNLSAKLNLKPATLAVLIQCVAVFTVLCVTWAIYWLSAIIFNLDLTYPIFTLVLLQALFAAFFSHLSGMASWWRWIHLGFPIVVWAMSILHIPNTFYLIGFIVTLSLYWTTFRTQVPFFPSRSVIWEQVLSLLPQNKPIRLIDIGSGLGDLSMCVAKARPESLIEGIEIAPLPWLVSVVRAKLKRSRAVFKFGDYHALDFANYDVIFAYLSPAVMHALWQKSHAEMRPGSLLMSYEFEIQGVPPSSVISHDDQGKMLYVWKIP
ncbi:MAG: class I SAM-dependent methyltransferase [Methylotenera sp.]|nr:class I SAM-dependent methyltransferase [Methylotenera sp.]MDO9389861.1 class I SAM-dependent methyltransferase [Methylotenera sp.]MDP2102459.1 class I SAM-dependent methyltransferase [Methylotenera sp.]MDP2281868.1 class I SAM-dependent methyltransferase [Methylotenera sp.]MDP3059148.1 class I SAM-dependent methyltransferase [Methylotenera sp.]